MSNEEQAPKEITSLLERLIRCKSRKSARESIQNYCDEINVKTKDYILSPSELSIFSALK